MSMLVVLYGHEKEKFPYFFTEMLLLRHRLFMEERGWALPMSRYREIDEYDCDKALYFFSVDDEDQRLQGLIRLTPSDIGSITADHYPDLINSGNRSRSKDVYEASRFLIRPDDLNSMRKVRFDLLYAVTTWCCLNDISYLQTVIDPNTIGQYIELSPFVTPQGLPESYGGGPEVPGGGKCMVIRISTNPPALREMEHYAEFLDGVSFEPNIRLYDSKSLDEELKTRFSAANQNGSLIRTRT